MLTSREELLAGCRRVSASLPAEQIASLPDSPQGSPYPRRDVAAGNPHSNPTPSPNPAPTPTPNPNPNPSASIDLDDYF